MERAHDEHGDVPGESDGMGTVDEVAPDQTVFGVPEPVARPRDDVGATVEEPAEGSGGDTGEGPGDGSGPEGSEPRLSHRTDDATLVERVRGGDDAAYAELWTRHEPAARRLAGRIAQPSDVEDLVSEGFTRTLDAIRAGGGPETAFRPYLLTTLRRVNIDVARRYTNRVVLTDDESAVDTVAELSAEDAAVEAEERDAVWAAWRSLPDDSRLLLWRLVVHEEKPRQLAPRLGTTPNGVASRSKRARERLRQVFLSELVANAGDPQCREVRRQLGGYVRDALPVKARQRVDDHLDRCDRCRAAVLDVVDVDAAIRLRVAPILLPGAFAAASAGAGAGVAAGTAGAAVGSAGVTGVPEPLLGVEGLLDDIEGLGSDAGSAGGGATVASRVFSVPGRSVAAVVAAAAILVAAVLFLLETQPSGNVTADAPPSRGPSTGTPGGSESWPTTTEVPTATPSTPVSVIGVATAEGASLRQSVRSAAARPRTTSPTAPRTPTGSGSSSGTTAPVGTVTTLRLTAGDRSAYLAHLDVPDGWRITSVTDVHGGNPFEHVSTPTRVVDVRLRPGPLVIEVRRTKAGVRGALDVRLVDNAGAVLPGSGRYALL